ARGVGAECRGLLADLDLDGEGRPSGARRRPELVAARIREATRPPCTVGALEIHMTVSVGIGLSSEDGGDRTALVNRADAAMYRDKRSSRGGHVLFAGEGGTLAAIGPGLRGWPEPTAMALETSATNALVEGDGRS